MKNKNIIKFLAIILSFFMIRAYISTNIVFAQGETEKNISEGNIEISDSETYVIKQSTTGAVSNTIKITGGSPTVYLDNLNLVNNTESPFEITGGETVTVILRGDNALKTTATHFAGLQKTNIESKLIIKGEKEDNIDSLTAIGGNSGAGIGGGNNGAGSNIYKRRKR